MTGTRPNNGTAMIPLQTRMEFAYLPVAEKELKRALQSDKKLSAKYKWVVDHIRTYGVENVRKTSDMIGHNKQYKLHYLKVVRTSLRAFFVYNSRKIAVLSAFKKKRDDTPPNELKKAKGREERGKKLLEE